MLIFIASDGEILFVNETLGSVAGRYHTRLLPPDHNALVSIARVTAVWKVSVAHLLTGQFMSPALRDYNMYVGGAAREVLAMGINITMDGRVEFMFLWSHLYVICN